MILWLSMNPSRKLFAILILLGSAASLSLEVIWARQLSLLLGSGITATACVLAAFMAGLAVGAKLSAWLVGKLRRPVRAFALAQLLAAGLSFLPLASAFLPGAIQLVGGLLLTALASVPLGTAFVLAGRARECDRSGRGGGLGRLVALDTAGAVVGCLATGLLAVPLLGLSASLWTIAGIKAFLGLACLAIPSPCQKPTALPEKQGALAGNWLLVMAAVQGLALLGAETLWSRLLAFALFRGSSTYALTAMLAVVLAAQSAGAWMAARRIQAGVDPRAQARRWAIFCGAFVFASLALLLVAGPVPSQSAVGPVDLLITLLACAPASFFSGGVFASLCRTTDSRGAGQLLFYNASGAVLGSLLIPLGLVPVIGLGWSLAAMACLPLLAASGLPVPSKSGMGRRRYGAALAIGLLGLTLPLLGPAWTRHLGPSVFYREGAGASVAVIEDPPGVRRLYVDGVAVAGTDLALATDQKGLAHLPILVHGRARSVLTVGFGSGGTSHSLLLHPGLRVDCVEIEPVVPQAAALLTEANHGLLSRRDTRFSLHLEDARRFLLETERSWDVIVTDCTDLAYRSDASLYTADFFRLMGRRLEPGGLAAAWIPMRGDAPHASLRSVVGAFADSFEDSSLWFFDALPLHFAILIGSDRAPEIDLDALAASLSEKKLARDLAEVGLNDPARLAASRHLDRAALLRFARGIARHTDDRPVVEYWAPTESGDDASAYVALKAAGPPSPPVATSTRSASLQRKLAKRLSVRPWLLAGHEAYLAGDEKRARACYLAALRRSPDDQAVRSLLGLGGGRVEALLTRLTQQPDDADSLAELGTIRLLEGDPFAAIKHLSAARKKRPRNPAIRLGLGLALLEAGDAGQARLLLRRLAADDSPTALAWRARLGLARLELGPILGRLTWGGI